MNKKEAKKQFDDMTEKFGIKHTFPFDTAWSFAKYVEAKSIINEPIAEKIATYSKKNFQKGIKKVESLIRKSDRAIEGENINYFNPLKHSFGDGVYVREIFNPAGELLVTKIHKYSHPFFLLKGKMTMMSEEGEKTIQAPHYGITKAGTKRIIYTHEDCIFVTVHATNLTDIDAIEKEIIRDDFEDIK